jgi:hypothetical protein
MTMADRHHRSFLFLSSIVIIPVLAVLATTSYAQTTISLPYLQKPHQIAVDGNDLYVFDEADYSLHVYTLSPFAARMIIGKKGDGQHDFKYLPFVYVQSESLAVTDFTKTVWFSKKGDALKVKEYSDFPDFDMNSEMLLVPIKENYVRITADHDQNKRHVYLLDPGFNPIKELYEGPFTWRRGSPVHYRTDTVCHEGMIFISDTEKDFFMAIFDHTGKDLFSIKLGREDEKPSQPLLHQYCVSDGRIYAATTMKKEGKTEMFVIDMSGSIVKRVLVPLPSIRPTRGVVRYDLFDVDQSRLYEIVKNVETGNWELLITELDI